MSTRVLKAAVMGIVALGSSINLAYADNHDSCNVNAENMPVSAQVAGHVSTIGFMVSARWGDGVLTLNNGEQRRFHLVGAKALETGAAANDFVGEVYNLKNVDDFKGTYYGASQTSTWGHSARAKVLSTTPAASSSRSV